MRNTKIVIEHNLISIVWVISIITGLLIATAYTNADAYDNHGIERSFLRCSKGLLIDVNSESLGRLIEISKIFYSTNKLNTESSGGEDFKEAIEANLGASVSKHEVEKYAQCVHSAVDRLTKEKPEAAVDLSAGLKLRAIGEFLSSIVTYETIDEIKKRMGSIAQLTTFEQFDRELLYHDFGFRVMYELNGQSPAIYYPVEIGSHPHVGYMFFVENDLIEAGLISLMKHDQHPDIPKKDYSVSFNEDLDEHIRQSRYRDFWISTNIPNHREWLANHDAKCDSTRELIVSDLTLRFGPPVSSKKGQLGVVSASVEPQKGAMSIVWEPSAALNVVFQQERAGYSSLGSHTGSRSSLVTYYCRHSVKIRLRKECISLFDRAALCN